jgi:hypothetical protein
MLEVHSFSLEIVRRYFGTHHSCLLIFCQLYFISYSFTLSTTLSFSPIPNSHRLIFLSPMSIFTDLCIFILLLTFPLALFSSHTVILCLLCCFWLDICNDDNCISLITNLIWKTHDQAILFITYSITLNAGHFKDKRKSLRYSLKCLNFTSSRYYQAKPS